jgi:hypothetical protein
MLGREYWSSGQIRYSEGYSVLSDAGRGVPLLVFGRGLNKLTHTGRVGHHLGNFPSVPGYSSPVIRPRLFVPGYSSPVIRPRLFVPGYSSVPGYCPRLLSPVILSPVIRLSPVIMFWLFENVRPVPGFAVHRLPGLWAEVISDNPRDYDFNGQDRANEEEERATAVHEGWML